MAGKVDRQPESLKCPLCFEVFKTPTLLACGHTFCKVCLDRYDEQHSGQDYMACPVCKKRTKLGQDRVAGLSPNFSLKGLKEELKVTVDGSSSKFCSSHTEVYKDIFCEECNEFMCITCLLEKHHGHQFKKKETLEADLEKKRNALFQKSQAKKIQIGKFITNAEQHKRDMRSHVRNLQVEISHSFHRKFQILTECKEKLYGEMNAILQDSESTVDTCIASQRQRIDNINRYVKVLSRNLSKNLDSDTLHARLAQYKDLEKELQKVIEVEPVARAKQRVESTQFCPSDEKVFDLGQFKQVQFVEATKDDSQVKPRNTVTGASQNIELGSSEEEDLAAEIVDVQAEVGSGTAAKPTIVRKVNLPASVSGMAVLSQDTVVVGYGKNRRGADNFSVSGNMNSYYESAVGHVYDIALLKNGRSVVSHGSRCFVYNAQNRYKKETEYICKQNKEDNIMLYRGQYDTIYAVNGCPEIYIFSGGCSVPQTEIKNIYPRTITSVRGRADQICATKTGGMITSLYYGALGSSIGVSRKPCYCSMQPDDESTLYMYAAVDSQDCVLVATLKAESDLFMLKKYAYESDRNKLIEHMSFKELKLPHPIDDSSSWCYMVSLKPNLIALATGIHLYFLEIPLYV